MGKNGFEEGFQNPAQNKDSRVPLVPELRVHFPRAQIKDSRPMGTYTGWAENHTFYVILQWRKTASKKASRIQHRIRIRVSRECPN